LRTATAEELIGLACCLAQIVASIASLACSKNKQYHSRSRSFGKSPAHIHATPAVSVQECKPPNPLVYTCSHVLSFSLFAERVADSRSSICVDAIDRRNVPRCSLPSFGRRDLLALAASSLFWRPCGGRSAFWM
jgi:hypothetical protein